MMPADHADADVVAGLARWLATTRKLAEVSIAGLDRPVAGYASETIFADVRWTGDGGPHLDRLVVRTAPRGPGIFADYDLRSQWQAQVAASRVGIPVADPVHEPDAHWIGSPFILMPRIEGHVVGPLAHLDPWLSSLSTTERARVHDGLLTTLAAVHRADPDGAPDVPRRHNGAELDHWEEYLSWSTHGHPVPALVAAIHWCRANRPAAEPAGALLWGDVRFENMVLDDDLRPRAVLDWDMSTVGAPEHDLAWFTSLDATQHALFGERADGFPDRDGTVARFEELSGRAVHDLEWYETLAKAKSAAIMTRVSVLRRDAGKSPILPIDDNPVLDLLEGRLT
jgi:aminoglycoside phosphotransferase (APT) family kinase protein